MPDWERKAQQPQVCAFRASSCPTLGTELYLLNSTC